MIYTVKPGETLASIAIDFRTSVSKLLQANPSIINPDIIYPGQNIRIPGLPNPEAIPYKIVVSLSNRKLSLFKNNLLIKTYPVGIGKMLSRTPTGEFVVVNREPNPGGPYGAMWLTLSKSGYGIHGTNNPSSIERLFQKGVSECITRMY